MLPTGTQPGTPVHWSENSSADDRPYHVSEILDGDEVAIVTDDGTEWIARRDELTIV
jgi:hypothetical protein